MRDQINDFTTTASENFSSTSDRVLDAILDGNRQAVDTVVRTADQLIEQLPEMPWADQLPTPTAVGTSYLDFVERAVEANREFNQRVTEMLTADHTATVKDAGEKATQAAKDAGDRVTKVVKDASATVTSTVKPSAAPAPKKAAAKKSAPKKASAKKSAPKKAAAKKTQTPSV